MMKRRITKRCLLASMFVLGLSITETVAQVEERQDAVGDVPIASDGVPEETFAEEDGTIDAEINNGNETAGPNPSETEEGGAGNDTSSGFFPETDPPTLPPTTASGCYDNFDAVYYHISNDDNLFLQKKFVICPGTIIDLGFLVPGVGIEKGQTPIIPRSNTEIICGEDGRVENNCLIRGGDFALIAVPVFFRQDLSVNNVLIKGLTFEGQVQYVSFMAVAGDIVFEDCIFRNQQNFGPILIDYDPELTLTRRLGEYESEDPFARSAEFIQGYRDDEIRRRKLKEEDNDLSLVADVEHDGRDLQTGSADILEVVIRGSTFEDIQQVERKLGVEFGIISVKSPNHKIILDDCTFANNYYGNQEFAPIGYAILIQGAEVELRDLCFINNDFRGSGAVLLEQTSNPFAPEANFLTNNYATEDDADVQCPFAAYFATDADRDNFNFTCVPVQVDDCGGEALEDFGVSTNGVDTTPSSALPSSTTLLSLLSSVGLLWLVFFR